MSRSMNRLLGIYAERHGYGDTVISLTDDSVKDLPHLLGLKEARPVIVVIGGADELDEEFSHNPGLRHRLIALLEQGLIPPALDSNAVILAGGTEAGIIRLVGRVTVG